MKSIILALSLLGISVTAWTQDDTGQSLIRNQCNVIHISLPSRDKDHEAAIRFKDIRVIDFRRDTSRIGLTTPRSGRQCEILFHSSLTEELTTYLNANYTDPGENRSLLIVVKDLWLSDPEDSLGKQKGFFSQPLRNIAFRWEAYYKSQDVYIPLTFLDTVTTTSWFSLESLAVHKLPVMISLFMDKVASIDWERILSRNRVVAYQAIDSFCRSRFDFPMDTATHLTAGVYASIDDFRNNQPSPVKYELTKDRNANIELRLIDKDGQAYYTHTVWGFCDGHQRYVMMDGNLFPIFCVYHQFYVLGSKDYMIKNSSIPFIIPLPGAVVYGTATVAQNVARKLRLYRLDVDSGEVIQ